jgi:phospholipid/cholesterol/gamma-HCH transport system substrate-binding protein
MRRWTQAASARMRGDKAVLGVVGLLAAAGLFAIVLAHVPTRLTAPGGHTVTAVFSDTQTLAEGDPVRVRGVPVGEVKRIALDPGGRTSTVRMSVSGDALPLYADARATARWRSLFGAAFVVDLDPGTPAAGRLDANRIPRPRTDTQVLLEDVTSAVVRGRAGTGLRTTLRELPRALEDRAAPRRALRALSDTAPPLRAGFGALRGERRGDLAALVANTARTVRGLQAPTGRLEALVSGAARTVGATAHRREDVRRSLRTAAASFPRVRSTADRLLTTLRLADPLIDRLQHSAAPLAPTSVRLRRTLISADGLLDDAEPLVHRLRPAVSSLRSAARTGAPVLADLRPSVDRVAEQILPGLARRSPESRRTTYEIMGPAFAGMTGAFASFDANNNFIRFTASFSETSLESAPCSTAFTDPRPGEVVTCEALVAALRRIFAPPRRSRGGP